MIDDKSIPNYQGFVDDVASEVRSLARSLNGTSTDEKAIFRTGGYLINNDSTESCKFCTTSSTNVFLSSVGADYSKKSRDIGILFALLLLIL